MFVILTFLDISLVSVIQLGEEMFCLHAGLEARQLAQVGRQHNCIVVVSHSD